MEKKTYVIYNDNSNELFTCSIEDNETTIEGCHIFKDEILNVITDYLSKNKNGIVEITLN